jgi:hypothetical protein
MKQSGWPPLFFRKEVAVPIAVDEGKDRRGAALTRLLQVPAKRTSTAEDVSTIDSDGYPHSVPTWFDVGGEDLIFSLQKGRARLKYIQANPKGAVAIGGELGDTEGYLFKGHFRLLDDPNHVWVNRMVRRYLAGEQAEQMIAVFAPAETVLLRFTPLKIAKVH